MPDDIRGRMFQIDVRDEQQANTEAARILKDAIESGDSFVVISCSSPERMNATVFDGSPKMFGDILLGNVAGHEGKYSAIILAGMMVQWLEQATGLSRDAVFAGIRGACRALDKMKGGDNVSGESGAEGVEPERSG